MVGLNSAGNLTQNPTWVIADIFHGLPLVLYLCWQAFYLEFDSGKQLQMYLTLNLFIGLLKQMNFSTG